MKTNAKTGKKHRGNSKLGHVPISDEITYRPLSEIRPSPENDRLYKPVDRTDPEFRAFVKQVRVNGITDALIITIDGYIVSGHRRYAAAEDIGFDTVPCRTANICHDDPQFLLLLRDCNRQRAKTLDEVLREEVVSANPEEAHRLLRKHREEQAKLDVETIELGDVKRRARITDAKRPFLDAILLVLEENRNFWPLSVRQIHYYLLNSPPLIHARKPSSVYRNNLQCYKAADELIARARFTREISFNAIHDPTRPVITWKVYPDPAPFLRSQLDTFLKGYYRDLMQSQPNHIEIIGEKNTVEGTIRPVALEYMIPYTIGRGYSSLPPRHEMAVRFQRSGKEKLTLLFLGDLDPEGDDAPRAFAQSMRDDFGIENEKIVPIKVALKAEQVASLGLPRGLTAKKTSSRRNKFVERHGENVFEMEAVRPPMLQQFLRQSINSVINVEAFKAEIEKEKHDAAFLETVRRQSHSMLGNLGTT